MAETAEYTNELGIANSSARVLPKNTVCLSRTASVGYVVVMDRPMATSQDFVSWVCSDEVEPEFLKYLLLAEGSGLLRFAAGAVHSTIYFPEVKAFYAAIPPHPQQRRIVGMLDQAFADVAFAREIAEKNLRNARAISESQLQSIFAQVGAARGGVGLSEVCERVTVGHVGTTSPHYRDGGVLFLRTQNVGRSGLLLSDVKYIAPEFHASLRKSEVRPGDVLMSRVITDVVRCALVPDGLGPANCANVVLVRPGRALLPQFLVHYIRSPQAQRSLLDRKVGSAQLVVNTTVVKNWSIPLPSVDEQRRIVERLDSHAAEAARLEAIQRQKLAALDALKQSLLHEAFAGNL